ncbi:hypothetical protein QBC39DRAFT_375007 [Podospora conica]|nr:hypothetical protein QBC39DRAFT_375007 [Schizothecium conicum]
MASATIAIAKSVHVAYNVLKSVKSTLKTYKKADRLVCRWDRDVRNCLSTFEGTIRTTLERCAIPSELVDEMVGDLDHWKWKDPALEQYLRGQQGVTGFQDWMATIYDIQETGKEVEAELKKFTRILKPEPGGGDVSDANVTNKVSAKYQRFKVSGSKETIEKLVKDLVKLNLQLLNRQPEAAGPGVGLAPAAPPPKPTRIPQDIQDTQRTLNDLYYGLVSVWACKTEAIRHQTHSMKLFFDSITSQASPVETQLRLGYAYQPKASETRLYVVKVRATQTPARRIGQNLRHCGDFCRHLIEGSTESATATGCSPLGYMDIDNDSGLHYSLSATALDICGRPACSLVTREDMLTLQDILDQDIKEFLKLHNRIGLAVSLINMVLCLHSTPWLGKTWTLGDIRFFRRGDNLVASLQTLYVEGELDIAEPLGAAPERTKASPSSSSSSDGTESYASCMSNSSTLALLEGIAPKEQLWCLGVALLQIDIWRHVAVDDTPGIAKQLKGASEIAPEFRDVVELCLKGRFECGVSDLSDGRAQGELIKVAGELGEMMEKLEGVDR